jgi:hypothetical protein
MAEEVLGPAVACGLFRLGQYHGEPVVHCPCCGGEYTHVEAVATRVGSDPYEAGVCRGTAAAGTTARRRSALVVTFECESAHRFGLVIQQHKGNNLVTVEVYEGVGPEGEHGGEAGRAQGRRCGPRPVPGCWDTRPPGCGGGRRRRAGKAAGERRGGELTRR